MKGIILFLGVLFSAFANVETEPIIDGIWVYENEDDSTGKTYLVVRGDDIQLYMESYLTAGVNQYYGGDKLIAQNSLFIHVDNYLTICPNTGNVVRYRNCPKHKVQRIKLHKVEKSSIKVEIIPGSSIYNSIMKLDSEYLFTSQRLGFRNWKLDDLDNMTQLNNDPDVMRYFPSLQNKDTTLAFIKKMHRQFDENQFCYFAVELLESNEFIGFIGLSKQDHGLGKGDFVDIGWRLKKSVWGQGLAPEGAKACLDFAYKQFGITEIFALASKSNLPSIRVMEKISMEFQETFIHVKLIEYPDIKECVLYRINL